MVDDSSNERRQVPVCFAKPFLRCGGDEHADDRANDAGDWEADDLSENSVSGLPCKPSIVILVKDSGGYGANCTDDTKHNEPASILDWLP